MKEMNNAIGKIINHLRLRLLPLKGIQCLN